MRKIAVAILISLLPMWVFAATPACDGKDNWAASMVLGYLKNTGVTDPNKVDFSKTKVVRLASEQIGKDLYRQVHYVLYTEKSGRTIGVITVGNASSEECSMSDLEFFFVDKHITGYGGPNSKEVP